MKLIKGMMDWFLYLELHPIDISIHYLHLYHSILKVHGANILAEFEK